MGGDTINGVPKRDVVLYEFSVTTFVSSNHGWFNSLLKGAKNVAHVYKICLNMDLGEKYT